MKIVLLAVAALAGALFVAAPASADCYGTQNVGVVCSTVNLGGTLYEDCVYLGSGPCTPVSVPGGPQGCITGGGPTWELVPICFSSDDQDSGDRE